MSPSLSDERPLYIVPVIAWMCFPPHPMTLEEWGEWWQKERAPLLRASSLTAEELAEGFRKVVNAWV